MVDFASETTVAANLAQGVEFPRQRAPPRVALDEAVFNICSNLRHRWICLEGSPILGATSRDCHCHRGLQRHRGSRWRMTSIGPLKLKREKLQLAARLSCKHLNCSIPFDSNRRSDFAKDIQPIGVMTDTE